MNIDDLPELRYGGEFVMPERDSYSFNNPYGVRGSNIAGTFSTLSRGVVGGPFELTVTLQLRDQAMLVWWDDFYNVTITEGSQRFVMLLLLNGIIQKHVVQIVGNPKLSTPGWKGVVELKLQALPIPPDRCTALARQVFQACYGSDTMCVIGEINTVANPYLNNSWNDELEPDTWLDFRNSLSMLKGFGQITFNRASIGTYIDNLGVLKTAGIDEPRFESSGLLIETQSSNLLLQSNNFATATWTKSLLSISISGTGPDSLQTANRLSITTASGEYSLTQAVLNNSLFPVVIGNYFVMSVFAKADQKSVIQMWAAGGGTGFSNSYSNFDLKSGLCSGTSAKQYMIPLANGWYKCVAIMQLIGDGSSLRGIAFAIVNDLTAARRATASGNVGDGLFISSVQMEPTQNVTSYINTTTAQVTRSADICWIQREGNSNYFNPFTVSVKFDTQPSLNNDINNRRGLFSGYPSTGAFEILMVNPTDNKIGFAYGNSTFSGGTTAINDFSQRVATGVFDGQINNSYLDGNLGTVKPAAVRVDGTDNGVWGQRLLIGYGAGGTVARQVNGHIKSVKLWKRALSPSEVKKVSK